MAWFWLVASAGTRWYQIWLTHCSLDNWPPSRRQHFQMHFLEWIYLNLDKKMSLKFVPKGPINNIPALVQIVAWRRSGDKPLSEPMMVKSRIYVTWPQWVKIHLFISSHIYPITKKFWTFQDHCAVLECARYPCDWISFPYSRIGASTLFQYLIRQRLIGGKCKSVPYC